MAFERHQAERLMSQIVLHPRAVTVVSVPATHFTILRNFAQFAPNTIETYGTCGSGVMGSININFYAISFFENASGYERSHDALEYKHTYGHWEVSQ